MFCNKLNLLAILTAGVLIYGSQNLSVLNFEFFLYKFYSKSFINTSDAKIQLKSTTFTKKKF